MSIHITHTPYGIVVREILASGERGWRRSGDGSFARTFDHKGPWLPIGQDEVPGHIKDAFQKATRK